MLYAYMAALISNKRTNEQCIVNDFKSACILRVHSSATHFPDYEYFWTKANRFLEETGDWHEQHRHNFQVHPDWRKILK